MNATALPSQASLPTGADKALDEATRTLRAMRARSPGAPDHRALRAAALEGRHVAQSVAMAGACVALLLALRDSLMGWWQAIVVHWAGALGVGLQAANTADLFLWRGAHDGSAAPTTTLLLGTGLAVALLFAATYGWSDRATPLKYTVRALCVVQASALVLFAAAPSRFGYTIPGHLGGVLQAGFNILVVVPAVMMLAYGALRLPLRTRLVHTGVVVACLALVAPHQAALHALVLHHGSVLFMPLLYFCFGVLLDVMVFIALFSWLASRLPEAPFR